MSHDTGNEKRYPAAVTESAHTDLVSSAGRPGAKGVFVLVNSANRDTRRNKPLRPPVLDEARIEAIKKPGAWTVSKPYPDPLLCSCAAMNAALTRKRIDVAFQGPIFLVPLVGDETSALRGEVPSSIAEAAMRHQIGLRYCPFDGELMDAEVKTKPLEPRGIGEPPCCCGTMDDLVRADRVRLPSLKTSRDIFAICATADRRPMLFTHCPFCATPMIELALVRRGHGLAQDAAETTDLAPIL